ncbi:lysylphosphatidylglycerol synthase transmembrane domain-containing protein [Leptospira ilyithenensis]|uniref:UPF0104 family protein n=1 Tax=Leptospira ilyithenensis TaxID=2484901 RepID=A0A4V3JWR4_9LEPT|nr:lysylphosphatidylglycerol synthase transmembrane domain-containing protein [Leptospira ilyithenensis]TGN07988.1 UPF0104 family protein [Leptospira ilyithenensis]
MIKIFISLSIGLLLFYLSARGITFSELGETIRNINFIYLIPVFGIQMILPLLRAYRLQYLYRPLYRIDFMKTLRINSVGYLFIMLLPMRLGEFIIPYLIKKNTTLSMSSSMAAIIVERITDLFVILSILFVVLSNFFLPVWLIQSALTSVFILFILMAFFSLVYFKSDFVFPLFLKIFSFLPKPFHGKLETMMTEFTKGLKVVQGKRQVVLLIVLSVFIWLMSGLVIYFLFGALNIKLNITHALIVMAINMIGVALPAGPGMIGNFQYSCIIALELFAIDKTTAFAFANVYYVIGMGLTLLYGFLLLPSTNLSFREIKRDVFVLLGK